MTQQTHEERWVELQEFPGYLVGETGKILSDRTGTMLRITKNSHGCPMVGLMKNGVQLKRSLPALVARTYLSPPKNEAFDTPIHLDGDRNNCHHSNLMWRPLWFARKYMRQFTDGHLTYKDPIEDVETYEVYDHSMHAAIVNGLLDSEIYLSMLTNNYVWPTGQIFRKQVSG